MWFKCLRECSASQKTFWSLSSWDAPLPDQRKYYHLGQCFICWGATCKSQSDTDHRVWSCNPFSDKTPMGFKWAVGTPEEPRAEAEPDPLEVIAQLCSFIDGGDRFQDSLDVSPWLVPALQWPPDGKNYFWQELSLHSCALKVVWRKVGILLGPLCWYRLCDITTGKEE